MSVKIKNFQSLKNFPSTIRLFAISLVHLQLNVLVIRQTHCYCCEESAETLKILFLSQFSVGWLFFSAALQLCFSLVRCISLAALRIVLWSSLDNNKLQSENRHCAKFIFHWLGMASCVCAIWDIILSEFYAAPAWHARSLLGDEMWWILFNFCYSHFFFVTRESHLANPSGKAAWAPAKKREERRIRMEFHENKNFLRTTFPCSLYTVNRISPAAAKSHHDNQKIFNLSCEKYLESSQQFASRCHYKTEARKVWLWTISYKRYEIRAEEVLDTG